MPLTKAGYKLHGKHFSVDRMEMSWGRDWQILSRAYMLHVGVLENGQVGLSAAMGELAI